MNTDKTFEETYDLIVLGTGLVQSLLAGAIALTGRKVIHVDKNDFYGEYAIIHLLLQHGNALYAHSDSRYSEVSTIGRHKENPGYRFFDDDEALRRLHEVLAELRAKNLTPFFSFTYNCFHENFCLAPCAESERLDFEVFLSLRYHRSAQRLRREV